LQVPRCEIRAQQGGRFQNGSQSDADLVSSDVDSRLRLGRHVFFADATSVSGAFVGLGNGSSVFDLNVDELDAGRNAVVRGVQGPFQSGPADCDLPAIQCGGQNVSVRRGAPTQTLAPGTYNILSLDKGTVLTLSPGVFTFCQIRADRNATIHVTGASQS